eukprot:SAG31_NODE_12973_length_903_cov_0.991294_2_plen_61_part_01
MGAGYRDFLYVYYKFSIQQYPTTTKFSIHQYPASVMPVARCEPLRDGLVRHVGRSRVRRGW